LVLKKYLFLYKISVFNIMKLKEEDRIRIERNARRIAELECGMRRPTHKIHKNKKAYTRKSKHKVSYT